MDLTMSKRLRRSGKGVNLRIDIEYNRKLLITPLLAYYYIESQSYYLKEFPYDYVISVYIL
jgi:hypothetical protein